MRAEQHTCEFKSQELWIEHLPECRTQCLVSLPLSCERPKLYRVGGLTGNLLSLVMITVVDRNGYGDALWFACVLHMVGVRCVSRCRCTCGHLAGLASAGFCCQMQDNAIPGTDAERCDAAVLHMEPWLPCIKR
jgi:hypothetical protein